MNNPDSGNSEHLKGKSRPGQGKSGQKNAGQSTTGKVDLYVVVADDDVDDHKLITKAVNDCGGNHLVTSVYNGQQLMNLLLRKGFYKIDFDRLPDILILDLKMPVMDGYQVLKELSRHPHLKDILVFILSDAALEEELEKARQLGADRIYSKPFSYEELRQLMSDICTEAIRLTNERSGAAEDGGR